MHRDERSYFWSAKKVTGLDATESAAFADLVGGLSSDDEAVGLRLSDAAADLSNAVDRLATADDRRNPLYSSRVVAQTFRQGRILPEEAMFGAPLDGTEPALPGGVVLAADGLSWTTC